MLGASSRLLALSALGSACLAAPLFSQTEAGETRALDVGQPAQAIDIVLDPEHFPPVDPGQGGAPITWRGCKAGDVMSRLKKKKPAYITREPRYSGAEQLYGYLTLGNRKNRRYYFALDVMAPDNMVMYFDFRNDGRLDEHPPLKDEGTRKRGENGFATMIALPWEQLIEDSPYSGDFRLWFILNNSQWAMAGFSHSSRTQLKGRVLIGGAPYTVVLADSALLNDADGDLTNDGLYLQKGKEKLRYISDEEARKGVDIDGRRYSFRIRYGDGRQPSVRSQREAAEAGNSEARLKALQAYRQARAKAERPPQGDAGVEWVALPGGSFTMGDSDWPDSKPLHRVRLKPFAMSKSLVTVRQFRACVEAGACGRPISGGGCNWGAAGRDDHPMNCVGWSQARDFCAWLGGSLPSEAQWEYAARSGGKERRYPWGDEEPSCERAVMDDGGRGCGRGSTWPVCAKPGGNTEQGLCDMAGNLFEWIEDAYDDSYAGAPADGSAREGPEDSRRLLRGGCFGNGPDRFFRTTYRVGQEHGYPADGTGFRVVKNR